MPGYLEVTTLFTGEVAGSTSAVQLPAALQKPCKRVIIRALSGNSGSVFIGFSSGVTVADGTSDATTGFELDAGDPPLIIDIQHTNQIWYICNNAGDDFTICIIT